MLFKVNQAGSSRGHSPRSAMKSRLLRRMTTLVGTSWLLVSMSSAWAWSSPEMPKPTIPLSVQSPHVLTDRVGDGAETVGLAPPALPEALASATASAAASCRDGRDEGDGGFIAYQMTDEGFFTWGAYMWPGVDSDTGLWQIDVFRDGKKMDSCRQQYPCHARYPPGVATPGAIFSFIGRHQGYLSRRWYQVYGLCKVPGR